MSPWNYKKEVKSQHEIIVITKKLGFKNVALKYFIYYCIATVYNL